MSSLIGTYIVITTWNNLIEGKSGSGGKMQAVKDKLHDMSAMHKAKAEAKAEEKVRAETWKKEKEKKKLIPVSFSCGWRKNQYIRKI